MPPASVPATAHLRFQEWTAAGVFLELWRVGLERFDELPGLGLELAEPRRGDDQIALGRGETGPNPTDRGQSGVKRSLLTEAHSVVIARSAAAHGEPVEPRGNLVEVEHVPGNLHCYGDEIATLRSQ